MPRYFLQKKSLSPTGIRTPYSPVRSLVALSTALLLFALDTLYPDLFLTKCYIYLHKKANYDQDGDGKFLRKEIYLWDEDNGFLRNFGNHLPNYTLLRSGNLK
jgi:hypothetical protein